MSGKVIINWKTVVLLLGALGSLASHPEVFNFLPEKWSAILSAIFTTALAFSNAVARIPVTRTEDAQER